MSEDPLRPRLLFHPFTEPTEILALPTLPALLRASKRRAAAKEILLNMDQPFSFFSQKYVAFTNSVQSKSTPSLAATIPSRDGAGLTTPLLVAAELSVSHHPAALDTLLSDLLNQNLQGRAWGLDLEAAQVILVIAVLVLVTLDNVSS